MGQLLSRFVVSVCTSVFAALTKSTDRPPSSDEGEETEGIRNDQASSEHCQDECDPGFRVVVSVTSSRLPGCVVDPADLTAEPCHFRLVDVDAFLESDMLQVLEYPPVLDFQDEITDLSSYSLPPFTAISYPWRDLQLHEGTSTPSFSVSGATHADAISISVIRTACIAARAYNCTHLWLDRLCIMQSSKPDKNWQIQRMFYVYRHCAICLVFPGGLVRLARLDDATSWIDRAWTLQEAVAPGRKKVKVVFGLTHASYRDFLEHQLQKEDYPESFRDNVLGSPDVSRTTHGEFTERVLEPGESAAADLDRMLWHAWIMLGRMRMHAPALARHGPDRLPLRIFRMPEGQLLRTALRGGGSGATGLKLWIAAYTRSSSRPVDMVFSIMGLLGVQLDVSRFQKGDRTCATIAVLQATMRRGQGYAPWLFIAPEMDPCRELSTLPEMPETSVSGRAYIQTRRGRLPAIEAIGTKGFESNSWSTEGAPRGELTDSGYLVFWGKAALLHDVTSLSSLSGEGGAHARAAPPPALSSTYDNREVWAVVVGRLRNLNRNPDTWLIQSTPGGAPKPEGVIELTLMLVERHGYELYHRVGMEREVDERKTDGWSWTYRRFQVGGPGTGTRVRFRATLSGPELGMDPSQEDRDRDELTIVQSSRYTGAS